MHRPVWWRHADLGCLGGLVVPTVASQQDRVQVLGRRMFARLSCGVTVYPLGFLLLSKDQHMMLISNYPSMWMWVWMTVERCLCVALSQSVQVMNAPSPRENLHRLQRSDDRRYGWIQCKVCMSEVCVCVYICRCRITWNRAKRVTQNCIIAPNTTAYLKTRGRDSNWLRWREPIHQAGPRCAESLIKTPAGGRERHRRTRWWHTLCTTALRHENAPFPAHIFSFASLSRAKAAKPVNQMNVSAFTRRQLGQTPAPPVTQSAGEEIENGWRDIHLRASYWVKEKYKNPKQGK